MKRLFSSIRFLACIIFVLLSLVVSIAGARSAQITFAWDRNPEPDISCYRIYRTTTAGQYTFVKNHPDDNDLVWEGTENTATVTAGETCWFVVTAVDRAGNESEPSDEVAYQADALSSTPYADLSLQNENGVGGDSVEDNDSSGNRHRRGGGCFVEAAVINSAMDPGVQAP